MSTCRKRIWREGRAGGAGRGMDVRVGDEDLVVKALRMSESSA
jgi:hypothetical protein